MSPEEILEHCTPHTVVMPFVERHGQLFTPQELPRQYRGGKLAVCFANSYRMAVRHDLTYVEGYAVTRDGHGHLHAWCVDDEGRVLDRTWRSGLGYFGIPFQLTYLKSVIRRRKQRGDEYYGLLDDWEAGFPLIRLHGSETDVWLAKAC